MADGSSPGCPGKSAVRDQRHCPVQILIAYDCLSCHKHLRHTASSGSLIPDYNNVSPADFFLHNSLVSIFLTIKNPGSPLMLPHLLYTCRIFNHGSIRGDIPPQDGYGALLLRILHRKNHLFPFQTAVAQISGISVKKAIPLQIVQIFPKGFPGNCHHIQIQHILKGQLHHGNSPSKPECLRQVAASGSYVSYMRHLVVNLVKHLRKKFNPQLPCNGSKMNDSVGRPSDGTVDHHRILKSLIRHNPAWTDILTG